MRILIILVYLMLCGLPGTADADLSFHTAAAERGKSPTQKNIFPGQKARISSQQAASRAMRRFPDNKILSIKLIKSEGPAVYRIKMLSEQAVVKFIFVDGNNGEVFQ